ncbi:hypothetical protein [Ferrovibrio sp.]|uniref:hypothetical protein n=1 Tax=Ferrovibrio sp. TaxID=1917215 RepID=UPI003D0E32BB
MTAISQELQFVGLKVARDTQLSVLSAVSASLDNIKQITAAANQGGAKSASGPLPEGVGGQVDVSA